MSDPLEEIRLHLSQHARHTRASYLWFARRFLREHADPSGWTPEAALAFVLALREQGWKPSSCQSAIRALRALYKIYGRPQPAAPRRMFAVDILNQERPALPLDELQLLPAASLRAPWPELAAMTALSTVFGLRGGEIGNLEASQLDLGNRLVRVPTGKGGPARIHALPEAILPVLRPEHFARLRSSTDMWAWWHDLERRAGTPKRPRQGWHAVRRGVTIALLDAGVPEHILEPWMGWGESLVRSVRRYGLRPRKDLDDVVFAKHPLLPVWTEVLGGMR